MTFQRKDHPPRFNVRGFDETDPFKTTYRSNSGKFVKWVKYRELAETLDNAQEALAIAQETNDTYLAYIRKMDAEIWKAFTLNGELISLKEKQFNNMFQGDVIKFIPDSEANSLEIKNGIQEDETPGSASS